MDAGEPSGKNRNSLSSRLSKFGRHESKAISFFTITGVINKAYLILLKSDKHEHGRNFITIQIGRLLFNLTIPRIIREYRTGIYTDNWGGVESSKRKWVYVYASVVYGIGYVPKERVVYIFHGVQSGNSRGFPKDKLKVWVPPSVKYNLTKHQICGKNDIVFWNNTDLKDKVKQSKAACTVIGTICPKTRFKAVNDSGEEILGSCYSEEKEWKRGLFLFGKLVLTFKTINRKILRIHLQVNKLDPTGKPTSVTHDFTMLPYESTVTAIKRYCERNVSELSLIEILK